MKKNIRFIVFALIGYMALWCLTYLHGPDLLKRQIIVKFTEEEARIRSSIAKEPETLDSQRFLKRIEGGPKAEVEISRCFAPVFEAKVSSSIGTFMQHSGQSWFIYTPWKIYTIRLSIKEA